MGFARVCSFCFFVFCVFVLVVSVFLSFSRSLLFLWSLFTYVYEPLLRCLSIRWGHSDYKMLLKRLWDTWKKKQVFRFVYLG